MVLFPAFNRMKLWSVVDLRVLQDGQRNPFPDWTIDRLKQLPAIFAQMWFNRRADGLHPPRSSRSETRSIAIPTELNMSDFLE